MSTEIECPQCGHHFTCDAVRAVDRSVVVWLTEELTWSGEEPTERMYASYLYSAGDTPVSRSQFVRDLAYLGVPEILGPNAVPTLVRR